MASSPLLALLHRYPLAAPFLLSLKPPAEFVGLHVVVANLLEALRWARELYVPSPPALGALQAELQCLLAELDATVTRSSLDLGNNLVKGELINHPEYALWSLAEPGPYRRERDTVAAVVLLLARGEVVTRDHLIELRRGLELGSDGRPKYAKVSKGVVERAHAATVLLANSAWDQEAEDGFDLARCVLPAPSDYYLVGAATKPEARLLAATIHDTFRRSLTRAGAYAPVGDRARRMLSELRRRATGPTPCPAAVTLLLSIFFQHPAGAVVQQTQWARLDDDCRLQADGIWRVDPDRGLASIPIAGFDSLWRPDADLAEHFPESDGALVVALPEYLTSALKRLADGRMLGPVVPDSVHFRRSLQDLVSQLRVVIGGRLSVRRIAGTLGFAVFEASQDMAALQRLAGHDLNDSLARGSYFCAAHAQLQGPLEVALSNIGMTDVGNPLPPLPPVWAERFAGASRLPQPAQLKELANQFNQALRAGTRSKPATRVETLTSLLAVHAAAQLMLAGSHRWSGAIGELTRWDVCPQVGLGIFSDKPVDALHARRLVMLPDIVRETLQDWLEYCHWLSRHAPAAVAQRARAALSGDEPLLFLVSNGTTSPVTLVAISEVVGSVGTALLRGSRCLISSCLRQAGVEAPRIDAQLGHTLYGEASFDVANLQSPLEFLAPVARATDRMLRELGFRTWNGAPARSRLTSAALALPAPWSPQIRNCVAEAEALASAERQAFAAAVDAALPAKQDAATSAFEAILAEDTPFDRKIVRAVFVRLCESGDGSAASAVAAGRAVHAALHQLRRRGIPAEGLSFYEPAFPTPPWLASRQLIAWHVQQSCLAWLHDPAKWVSGSLEMRAARLALLLLVHGVIDSLDQALALIHALPSVRGVQSAPDALLAPVNWPSERRPMPAETATLMGDLSLAAIGVLRAGGCASLSRQELSAALASVLRTSPWPPSRETTVDQILAGFHDLASLCGVLAHPGAIAARIRGDLPTRDLPVDLCRALLDNVAAAPPQEPARPAALAAEARKRGAEISDGAFISEVHRRLDSGSPAGTLHSLAMTVTGPRRVVAEVASRLTTLAGDKVDRYAVGSQRTFLSLIAAPLLKVLKGVDLENATAVEECLVSLWHDAEPDSRRLVGLQLAAEVLEDLFLGEPLELDGIPPAPNLPKFPRALMPAAMTWERRGRAFSALLDRHEPESRLALHEWVDSLNLQSAFNLRTGEAGALRHGDLTMLDTTLVARVAPHRDAVIKSPSAIRSNEVARSPELDLIAGRFDGKPANSPCFVERKYRVVGVADRSDLFRQVTGDWRLRPHDLRSAFGSTTLHNAVAVLDEHGHWQLRSDPDSQHFREASARLGHSKPRTTFASYVHVVRFWQALRLRGRANGLTLTTIASLVGITPDDVKERVRRLRGAS